MEYDRDNKSTRQSDEIGSKSSNSDSSDDGSAKNPKISDNNANDSQEVDIKAVKVKYKRVLIAHSSRERSPKPKAGQWVPVIGEQVETCDLTARPELYDRVCKVLSWQATSGYFAVKLDKGVRALMVDGAIVALRGSSHSVCWHSALWEC